VHADDEQDRDAAQSVERGQPRQGAARIVVLPNQVDDYDIRGRPPR
jgi:hypothetical protein